MEKDGKPMELEVNKLSNLKSVEFQPAKGGDWQPGIMINHGDIGIINLTTGELFTQKPWDFREVAGLELDREYIERCLESVRKYLGQYFKDEAIEKMFRAE